MPVIFNNYSANTSLFLTRYETPEYTVKRTEIAKHAKPMPLTTFAKSGAHLMKSPEKSIITIVISVKKVLILPDLSAASTFPFLAASILSEETAISLAIITDTPIPPKIKPHLPNKKNKLESFGSASITVKATSTKTLSAIGSKNLPKSVTKLYFLAMCPSKKSVKAATPKIASDTK